MKKINCLSALCGLLLTFTFTQLNSQVQNIFEDDDYTPPHPDSLSELMEGIDVQYYSGGEAVILKSQNLPTENSPFSKASGVEGFENVFATPNVFDTNIKPDVSKSASGGPPLAKTADTSLCNQIMWSEPMLLFENMIFLNISVSGDTVHAVADSLFGKNLPYRRSTNSGLDFEPVRNVYRDTVGRYAGGGWPRLFSNGDKVFIVYGEPDASTGDLKTYYAYTVSTDGGKTFTPSRRIVEYEAFVSDVANSGDTIAVVIGDNRWTRGTPVPKYIYISTNFGETWKFRGYAGGRRVFEPRIALAGRWLQQVNQWGGRNTNIEAAYYRSKIKNKSWSSRKLLSTNDGMASVQPDVVAEPNGFVGVLWGDGKYGSKYGWDGTPMFRRSLNFGKTFEPEVRLTDSPEASWGIMKLKSITSKLPVVSAVWCATWENEYRTNAIRLSLNGGSSWCPIYYQHMGFGALSPSAAVGNGKIYWTFYNTDVGSYFVSGILPGNLKTETAQTIDEGDKKDDQIIKIENYPNPFNPFSNISYNTTQSGYVTLRVYDVLGREVTSLINNEWMDDGEYEYEFDGSKYSSGIYYCQFTVSNEEKTTTKFMKINLIK